LGKSFFVILFKDNLSGKGKEMGNKEEKENVLKYKLIYSGIMTLIYVIGKNIPLYRIDISAYRNTAGLSVEDLLVQSVSGDLFRSSIFALGIFPSMISGFLVQIFMAIRGWFTQNGISPGKSKRITVVVTLIIAMLQVVSRMPQLKFDVTGEQLNIVKVIAALEMTTGAMIIMWMASRNSKYGLGGRMVFMVVNILERISLPLVTHTMRSLVIPLMAGAVMMMIMLVMENAEKRIPVQRISIHNIYANKNYMAIKLNPVGMMPMMFANAVFMLPGLLISLLLQFFPYHQGILWWQENLSLTKPFGIFIYIVCEYLLTIGFAMLMISPKDISENFLKSGDSIVNLHAGRDTRRYLRGVMWRISLFSATVMGLCISTPMIMQLRGNIDSTLVTLPTSMMLLMGFSCNLYREICTLWAYDSCKPLF